MADENKTDAGTTTPEPTKTTTVPDKGAVSDRNPEIMKVFNENFGNAYKEGEKKPDAGQSPVSEPSKDNSDTTVSRETTSASDEGNKGNVDTEKEELKSKVAEYEERLAKYEAESAEIKEKIKSLTPKTPEAEKEPQMPTQAEFEADPLTAAEKVYAFKEYQKEKKQKEADQKKQAEDKVKTQQEFSRDFWKKQAEIQDRNFKVLLNDNPSLKDKNSSLYKEADKVLKEIVKDDPAFELNPYKDSICVNEAIKRLAALKSTETKASQLNNGTFIMQRSSGTGIERKTLSRDEFDALSKAEREAYMKEEYMGRGQT